MKKVMVLMSTYNGEKYIVEQIESILRQKGVELQILIRDDGSKDRTMDIITKYANKYPNILHYTGGNLGPAYSFLDLINKSYGCDYYALCDQDDVWDDDKLLIAVNMLEKLNTTKPALYYSNLRIVDQNLNYFRLSHNKRREHKTKYLALTEGLMTGCTGVFNESCAALIRGNKPIYCSMHDTWIYMICKFFGETVYDFEPHISYRQHEGNAIGTFTKKKGIQSHIKRLKRLLDRNLQPKYNNAKSFLHSYEDIFDSADKKKVEEMGTYKDGFGNWMRLLFDKEIHTTSISREIRYRGLILLRII